MCDMLLRAFRPCSARVVPGVVVAVRCGADGRPRRVRRGHASGSGADVVILGHAVRGEDPRRHGAALRAAGARGGARRPGPGG